MESGAWTQLGASPLRRANAWSLAIATRGGDLCGGMREGEMGGMGGGFGWAGVSSRQQEVGGSSVQ